MSAKRDYYEVLGVSKSSPIDEIKSQYRKMALKFHPDRNKSADAVEHFKEISEAYAVLSDPGKKKLYDQYGHEGVDGKYSREDIFQGARGNFSDVFGDIFGQRGGSGGIFDSIFGGGFGGFERQRGEDLLCHVSVSLADVLRGKRITVGLKTDMPCVTCSGSGCYPGTSKRRCDTCRGNGQVRVQRNMGFTAFVTVQPCSKCRGAGHAIERPCKDCRGNGVKKGTKQVSFDLPQGVDNGEYTLQGQGGAMPGGTSGNLTVRVRVEPHPHFKRDGRDIFYDEKVSIVDATLGKEVAVPTLDGRERIKIKPGSQPNTIIKLSGKGVRHINARGRGDQYVRLVVEIPTRLSKNQKRLLEEFEGA
jgi:molecular chaperone DnaJ